MTRRRRGARDWWRRRRQTEEDPPLKFHPANARAGEESDLDALADGLVGSLARAWVPLFVPTPGEGWYISYLFVPADRATDFLAFDGAVEAAGFAHWGRPVMEGELLPPGIDPATPGLLIMVQVLAPGVRFRTYHHN